MKLISTIAAMFVLAVLLLTGAYFIPWNNINWGQLEMMPAGTITVQGYAEKTEQNQVARFSAGVTAVNDSKDEAVAEVNRKTEAIIQAVKQFGIPAGNIKTRNLSIHQRQDTYYDDGQQKVRKGQWSVSNNVEVKLVEANKADDLANLLAETEATNVYGPNFQLENNREAANDLIADAIEDARQKAESVAQASNRQLGKIVSVNESGISQPGVYRMMDGLGGAGGGAPIEPGTGTVSKTVVVIFELE